MLVDSSENVLLLGFLTSLSGFRAGAWNFFFELVWLREGGCFKNFAVAAIASTSPSSESSLILRFFAGGADGHEAAGCAARVFDLPTNVSGLNGLIIFYPWEMPLLEALILGILEMR